MPRSASSTAHHSPRSAQSPSMKLSVSTYSLWRWRRDNGKTLEDAIGAIASCDVAGIEFSGLDDRAKANPLKRATALRKCAERRGLKVVSYCVGAELLRPHDEQRAVIEQLKREVDTA